MLQRVIGHARNNVVAYLALFIALGGVGVAATNPLRDKEGAVKSSHIADGTIRARDVDRSLGIRKFVPPADGEFDGEWAGGGGTLKIFYEDQEVSQVIYIMAPFPGPECTGIFVNPKTTTTKGEQYLTGTNAQQNQNIQLHIEFDTADEVTILQGALTQDKSPTSCGVPAGVQADR